MAFSFGFFNSKNLDRTYTAENFNDYLAVLFVTEFRTNFGQCFKLSAKQIETDNRQRKGLDSGALFHFGYGIHL